MAGSSLRVDLRAGGGERYGALGSSDRPFAPRTRILWAGDELAFAHKTHTDALCIHQLLEYVHVDGYHNIMQLQLRMLL